MNEEMKRFQLWSFHVVALILGFLLCFDNAAAYSLASEDNSLKTDGCANTCSTSDCTTAESVFLANMDQTVKPCDDFYQFVCGNYVKNTEIPSDKSSVNSLFQGEIELEKILLEDMNKPTDSNDLDVFKSLKNHFKNCMDEDLIEQDNLTEFSELMNKLGGWPVLLGDQWKENDFNWEDTALKISQTNIRNIFPFGLYSYYDPTDSSKFLLRIEPGGTTITESYFASGSKSLEAYKNYMIEIAVLLGADRTSAETMAKESIEFETKIQKAQTEQAVFWEIPAAENTQTIKVVTEKYPDVDWINILNKMLNPYGITIDEKERSHMTDPKYAKEIGAIIKNASKRTLANYQIWTAIAQLINYLPKRFREQRAIFIQHTDGVKKIPKREVTCQRIVKKDLKIALGSLYVRTHFDRNIKNNISDMVQKIKQQMKKKLESVEWMDEKTRDYALIKVDKMSASIAYPDEILDDEKMSKRYTGLNVEVGSFLKGFIAITKVNEMHDFQMLRKSVQDMNWVIEAELVADVNAYYNPAKNTMILIAGILQQPFFVANRPQYLNYGGMGYVIGHETTHGFDSYGRGYDADGNEKDWWNNKTAEEYKKRAQCLINQFNNYTVKQINEKADGKLTQIENIADSGVKLAYNAYNDWVNEGHSEGCLPNLNYTPNQMFWINAATVWCSKSTDEALRKQVKEDPHAPDEARINVAFSNIEAFAKDFNCAAGSKMNPVDKCEVW